MKYLYEYTTIFREWYRTGFWSLKKVLCIFCFENVMDAFLTESHHKRNTLNLKLAYSSVLDQTKNFTPKVILLTLVDMGFYCWVTVSNLTKESYSAKAF